MAIKFGVSYGVHGEMFHQIVASIGWDLGWRKSQRRSYCKRAGVKAMRTGESNWGMSGGLRTEPWRTPIFEEEAKREEPAEETKKQQSERWEEDQVGLVCGS